MTASSPVKSVLVTGAAGGLGKVIAATFLDAGAHVTICDISTDRLLEAEKEWLGRYEGRFQAVEADITSEESVKSLVAAAASKFGRLDVLVTNAGVMDDFSPAGDCARAIWDRVLAVNATGAFLASQAAIKQMERQAADSPRTSQGLMINIASTAATRGLNAGVAYTASKAALVAITKNTAGFYGARGINCVALVIGGMDGTHIADAFASGLHAEFFAHSRATMTPFEVGKHDVSLAAVGKYCVFLSSDLEVAQGANGGIIPFSRNWPEV